MTWENRYEFSVLEVIGILVGEVSGSHGGTSKEDLLYYKNWLQRRVDEWQPSRLYRFAEYESTILNLAKQALKFYE
jgi:hypothetical protein